MKPIVIYHSPCMDGFTAAWAVWQKHPDWEFYPGVHGEAPPDVTGREVYLVDFSYKRPVMEALIAQAASVTVLDHHKTAQADLEPLLESGAIKGVFDMERSGARITWAYFNPDATVRNRPMLIDYVEDRDLWRFAFPETREVCAAIFSLDYSFETWNWLELACDENVQDLVREGRAIERKQQKDIKELLSKVQYPLTIGGVEVPAANLPYIYSSDAGHIMCQGKPFAATYFYDGTYFKFSLRSEENGADVSEIAKQYGGGGHKHASGFQVKTLAEL